MLSVIHLFLLILLCLAALFFTAPRLFLFGILFYITQEQAREIISGVR